VKKATVDEVKKATGDEFKYIGTTHHVDIFDCTEKEVPVQSVQLTEAFVDLGWDSRGEKFCVLMGRPVTSICIYKPDKGKPAPLLITRLEGGPNLTTVDWAPAGGWLVVHAAGYTGSSQVHFIDASSAGEAVRFRKVDLPSLTEGSWDPTGRYYSTCSLSVYKQSPSRSDGYRIFTFQGRELVKKHIETLLQFKWRPRLPVTLPEERIKAIKENMKTLSKRFEAEDRAEHLQVSKERRDVYSKFVQLRSLNRGVYEKEEPKRTAMRSTPSQRVGDQSASGGGEEDVNTQQSSAVEPLGED